MSTALPCIGFNTGGIPELIESNFVVQTKNVNELVRCIKEFDNLELYQRVATRNFNKAKEYEHSTLSSKIRLFFGQIKEEINNVSCNLK